LEGFQTSIRLGGYMGRIYSAHDIWTFCVAVAVWCRELEQGDSWFHYHAQWHIYFVHFACEQDGKILFITSIFLIVVLYENVYSHYISMTILQINFDSSTLVFTLSYLIFGFVTYTRGAFSVLNESFLF
jgi:hypothetical protein